MASKKLTLLYNEQYKEGEWSGPRWYTMLEKWIKTREEVVAELIPKKTQDLLDLGCGEGNLLIYAQKKYRYAIGTDLLESRLNIAKRKTQALKNKCEFKIVDLDQKLPFQESQFDVVTCVSVIEYVLDPISTIREIHRITKKNGVFIIEVPNIAYILERLRLLCGKLVGVAHAEGWQGGRLHHFTFETLTKFLEKEGWIIEKKTASGFLNSFRSLYPSLLSSDIIVVCRKI